MQLCRSNLCGLHGDNYAMIPVVAGLAKLELDRTLICSTCQGGGRTMLKGQCIDITGTEWQQAQACQACAAGHINFSCRLCLWVQNAGGSAVIVSLCGWLSIGTPFSNVNPCRGRQSSHLCFSVALITLVCLPKNCACLHCSLWMKTLIPFYVASPHGESMMWLYRAAKY